MVIYQPVIVSIGKGVNVVVTVTHRQRKALDGGSEVGANPLFESRLELGALN